MKRRKLERLCGELGSAITEATDLLLRDEETVEAACDIISRLNELDLQWRDTCCSFLLNQRDRK